MSGQFCDVTSALFRSRTGAWAFSFSGVNTVADVSTPEPSTWLSLLSAGLAGALLLRRKLS